MLIHELTIATQHDRERDVRQALTGRRLLDGCRAVPRSVLARVRAILHAAPPPAAPAGTAGGRGGARRRVDVRCI
jgi:hypothetical protein